MMFIVYHSIESGMTYGMTYRIREIKDDEFYEINPNGRRGWGAVMPQHHIILRKKVTKKQVDLLTGDFVEECSDRRQALRIASRLECLKVVMES